MSLGSPIEIYGADVTAGLGALGQFNETSFGLIVGLVVVAAIMIFCKKKTG